MQSNVGTGLTLKDIEGAPNGRRPLSRMGKQETANAVQESGYLSITGPDGFRRNPQNL